MRKGKAEAGEGFVPPLKRPEFRRLLGISITVALGFGMVVPVLPLYAKSFGVGLAAIGIVQLVFGLTRFSFQILAGLVVDRFGVRASTMAGLLIVSLSSYAAGFAHSFPELVAARGFGGAGSALFMNGTMNQILRLIEPEAMGRATGGYRSSFLVGTAAGPLFGGLVADRFGLAAPFIVYATGLLVATAVAWFVMEPGSATRRAERRTPVEALRTARPLFGDLRFIVALLATFAGWWTLSGPAQWIGPVFARETLGFDQSRIGPALTLLAVGELVALLAAGRAVDSRGRRAVMVPSLLAAAAAIVLLGQIDAAPWAFYPLMSVAGAGIAASGVAAGALLADVLPRSGSGAAVGVNQMAGDLGYLVAPTAIGGIAGGLGFPVAFAAGALPGVVVAGTAARLPRRPAASAGPHYETGATPEG